MKYLLLSAILLLVGCDSRPKREGLNDFVADSTGKHELVLERTRAEITPEQLFGYEFKSLVWRFKQDGKWTEKTRITKGDFQLGSKFRRSIVELDDFDPGTGIAVIKVAEADAPPEASVQHFLYSWREWNLLSNTEVKLLKICSDPFESYR